LLHEGTLRTLRGRLTGLAAAGLRDGRLHDARRTAGTMLLILGVPERAVMGLMCWSSTGMAAC
jgi:hypothetical protein